MSDLDTWDRWLVLCRDPAKAIGEVCSWLAPDIKTYTIDTNKAGRWEYKRACELAGTRDMPVRMHLAQFRAMAVVRRGTLGLSGELEQRT